MIAEYLPGLQKLTREQKVQVLDELWLELAEVDAEISPDDPLQSVLNARMAEYRADPSLGSPWPEVRERLRKALK